MREKKYLQRNEEMFSNIVTDIFRYNGYTCHDQSPRAQKQEQINYAEWLFERDGMRFLAEILFSSSHPFPMRVLTYAAQRQKNYLTSTLDRVMLVVCGVLESGTRDQLMAKGIVTIDVPNLLYMARSNQLLLDQLTAALPFSVGDVKPVKPSFFCESGSSQSQTRGFQDANSHTYGIDFGNGYVSSSSGRDAGIVLDAGDSYRQLTESCEALQKTLRNWVGGKETSSGDYEKLCTRTLKLLFADDLTLWNEQAKSNGDLYRFDLICKIKRDNHKDFWEMAERYFNSKYIIFEFKNYSKLVTQKEVYTTLRYLYATALRRVAIIFSPNGIDEHADKAIRGALRDEGKLILTMTNGELIHLLEMKKNGKDPADYLSDKLDALLIDLEK